MVQLATATSGLSQYDPTVLVLMEVSELAKVTTPKCNSDLSQTAIKATVKASQ